MASMKYLITSIWRIIKIVHHYVYLGSETQNLYYYFVPAANHKIRMGWAINYWEWGTGITLRMQLFLETCQRVITLRVASIEPVCFLRTSVDILSELLFPRLLLRHDILFRSIIFTVIKDDKLDKVFAICFACLAPDSVYVEPWSLPLILGAQMCPRPVLLFLID